MSIEAEDVLAVVALTIGVTLYLAIGSVVSHLLGINAGFTWYAVTLGWPVVVGFLVILMAMFFGLVRSLFR